PQLEDPFKKASDYLARAIGAHNYQDIRELRHRSLTSYEAPQKIDSAASALIERLKKFATSQLSSASMRGAITAPANRSPVPQRPLVIGSVEGISDLVDVWLVVETGGVWHPQIRLTSGAATFQANVSIGRSGSDAGEEFPIHVVAVTEDVTSSFERYRK